MTYKIRIVGDPDFGEYDEHEVIPFDGKDQLENFSNVLEKRGIPHSTQAPIETDDEKRTMTDGGRDGDETERGESVEVRKKDTSKSTRDYWRNGAGDHPYHRHDEPCEDAPEHGYMIYESHEIHCPEDVDLCPNCDWSGTDLGQYADSDADESDARAGFGSHSDPSRGSDNGGSL